jgi:hypothetical protein
MEKQETEGTGMTIQELYEKMRVEARTVGNTWDDLDYASGFCDEARQSNGEFLPWEVLPKLIQITFTERLAPWLGRYD